LTSSDPLALSTLPLFNDCAENDDDDGDDDDDDDDDDGCGDNSVLSTRKVKFSAP